MHDCILSSNSGFVKTFLISDVQPTENGRGSTPFSPSFHCFFWHCQRNVILRKQVELAFPFLFFCEPCQKNGRGSTPFSPSFHCFFWHCQRNVILRKQVELAFPFSFFVKVTKKMVGVARFELAAPCSQNRCANRTALYPDLVGYYTPLNAQSQVKTMAFV